MREMSILIGTYFEVANCDLKNDCCSRSQFATLKTSHLMSQIVISSLLLIFYGRKLRP